MINPSKSKEGAQREMGQTGTPHGVREIVVYWYSFSNHRTAAVRQRDEPRDRRLVGPRLLLLVGGNLRVRTETVNGFKARMAIFEEQ